MIFLIEFDKSEFTEEIIMPLGFIIKGLIPIAAIDLAIYLVVAFCMKNRIGKQSFLYHLARYSLIGCVLSLVYLTIFWGGINFDYDGSYHLINLQPFTWLSQTYSMGYGKMINQLITNIFMFVPYGLLLPIVYRKLRKWWKTAVVIFLSTFAIEFIQYFIGRSCDIDDIIMNLLGGCIGYGLYCLLHSLCKEKIWYKNMVKVME